MFKWSTGPFKTLNLIFSVRKNMELEQNNSNLANCRTNTYISKNSNTYISRIFLDIKSPPDIFSILFKNSFLFSVWPCKYFNNNDSPDKSCQTGINKSLIVIRRFKFFLYCFINIHLYNIPAICYQFIYISFLFINIY